MVTVGQATGAILYGRGDVSKVFAPYRSLPGTASSSSVIVSPFGSLSTSPLTTPVSGIQAPQRSPEQDNITTASIMQRVSNSDEPFLAPLPDFSVIPKTREKKQKP